MTKTIKTGRELQAIVMCEIRKHPECSRIVGVAITRPVQRYRGAPNWDVGFVCDDPGVEAPRAWEIARELQHRFALTPKTDIREQFKRFTDLPAR